MTQTDATPKARVAAGDRADLRVDGPSSAGVACAIEAARAGLRVILIERKTDEGEKLHTTGMVVKEAADEIEPLGKNAALPQPIPSSQREAVTQVR